MKTAIRCLFCVSLAFAALAGIAYAMDAPPAAVPESTPAPKEERAALTDTADLPAAAIEPALARMLARAAPDDAVSVIVVLREQASLGAAERASSPEEARSRLVAALRATADRSQAPLRAYLDRQQRAGRVASYRPLWIVNAVAVRAAPDAVRTLAARPDVAAVQLDHYRRWIEAAPPALAERSEWVAPEAVEWGVARIRADEVWASLHVTGAGAVVAGMDTGVDWLHPALQANYRGYNPHGPANHAYNWYDATGAGALYPMDGHGHGSHTMGTMVGQDGIGVAPSAQWIAVRVLSSQGYGYDSWIHAGFQWVLAPGGNPAMAPDVVNCSWGNNNGWLTTFQADIRALRAAGILAVFANGNSGPNSGTVGSPASLPGAFAVGATDANDEAANFSSRGPSPWGEIRPHVAAPGVSVRSGLPGGVYGRMSGTSMAAPHVSGLVALLRSVSPTLSITRTMFLITSTATPLGDSIPNNDTGWGRVDAFAAVAALAHPGFVTGTVTRAGDGLPIAGALVSAAPRGSGGGGTATTGGDGTYRLALAADTYDLTATAFGYQPASEWGIVVTTDTVAAVDFSLSELPMGVLRGRVTDAATGAPVTATIAVLDTPVQSVSSVYTFTLPEGDYVVRARSLGYQVVTATARITAGQVVSADFALAPIPSILLVDSGAWYYGSQIGYFRQALDDMAYAYDEWAIRRLPRDVPTAEALSRYDIVVWSAPEDAPGFIGAQSAITGYLAAGGRLFLSGQDVGYLDDGGMDWYYYYPYYRDYLKVSLADDEASSRALEGLAGELFAGMAITIAGAGGADNQSYPDVIAVLDPDAAAPVLAYQGDGCGGARVGTCLDYRVIYLSFGFEAINDRAARREVMARSLAWLTADPPAVGLRLTPVAQSRIGPPGAALTYTLRVRHLGPGGVTDTVHLTLEGASWAAQIGAPALTLAPCASGTVVVTITVPLTAAWNARDEAVVTARSSLSPTLVLTAALTAKAPAPILLVDDDRFYEQRAKYQAAMEGAGLPYDVWQTHPATGAGGDASPAVEMLRWYPVVVWWTGYDWYRPVTADEEAALAAYLDSGGRLFLSSQDFMYYHRSGSFPRDYLGVLDYTEDATPTMAAGVPGDPVGDRLGPYALSYPFRNWSDALTPMPGVAVSFRDQWRRGVALARQGEGHRTVFFSFPFEALPEASRPDVMERVVGWLSWLGGSTFSADRSAAAGGGAVTYTLLLLNDGPTTATASLSNTLPVSLTLVPGSLTGPAGYDPLARRVAWEGPLGPGARVTVTYQATMAVGMPAGALVVNTARLGLEDQGVRFGRSAVVRVDAPALDPSSLRCAPDAPLPGGGITCTLALVNAGPADALSATAVVSLPVGTTLVSGSLAWEGGGTAEALGRGVRWSGPLSGGGCVTVTYRLRLPAALTQPPLYSVAFLSDGAGGAWERAAWVQAQPRRLYLPLAVR